MVESAHLEFGDDETAAVDRVYNFTSVHVHVRFDHCESRFLSPCKRLPRESITIVNKLELSGVDRQDRANEEFVLSNSFDSHSLEEHSSVFQIVLLRTI